MREQVLIVLNERESQKRRAADLLAAALEERGITSSRIKIDDQIERRIIERHPPTLVIDYLLGDSSTALDVLSKLRASFGEECPHSYLFTDEPSATVAATALRLGAKNFFPLDNPASIEHLADEIATARPKRVEQRPPQEMSLDELVAGDPLMQRLIQGIQGAIVGKAPAILLTGNCGSGRSSIARALARSERPTYILEHDFRFAQSDVMESIKRWQNIVNRMSPPGRLLLILDQMGSRDTDGAEHIARCCREWSALESSPILPVIICNDEQITRTWERLLEIRAFRIPSLADRSSDVAALAQRFFKLGSQAVGVKGKVLDAHHLQTISKLPWPEELHSLRRTMAAAATLLSMKDRPLGEAISEAHELMLREIAAPPPPIDKLTAARTLWECQGNTARAAARLGCSASELYELFQSGAPS